MKFKIFLFLFLIFLSLAYISFPLRADEDSDLNALNKKIEEYTQKIKELQGKQKTLASAIDYFDNKIALKKTKIAATEQELKILVGDIEKLSVKIGVLDKSLDNVSAIFNSRVEESYKRGFVNPVFYLFSSRKLGGFLSQLTYLQIVQDHDRELLFGMQKAKMNYGLQKKLKKEKQKEMKVLRQRLVVEKQDLARQKQSKQELLNITRNDEQKYQDLLNTAIAEVASLKRFAASQGGDICLASSPGQPDGWFWSQRDPRWCKQNIGLSSENIGTVGCLVSSVAMVWQKYGQSKTPAQIAADTSYFFSNTAYMLNNPPLPNYSCEAGYGPDFIDEKLKSDQPVIVHLDLGGDGHFVVLKSGSKGDYIMNDPWNGANLNLNDYYSVYSINRMCIFHP